MSTLTQFRLEMLARTKDGQVSRYNPRGGRLLPPQWRVNGALASRAESGALNWLRSAGFIDYAESTGDLAEFVATQDGKDALREWSRRP
jgi:hypothetical protein